MLPIVTQSLRRATRQSIAHQKDALLHRGKARSCPVLRSTTLCLHDSDTEPPGEAAVSISIERAAALEARPVTAANRWLQLVLGLICMMAISSPQYVWALLTKPMTTALAVKLPELQVTFSLLIV